MGALREKILAMEDLKTKDIEVPEWGDAVIRVREMSAAQRIRFQTEVRPSTDPADFLKSLAFVVVTCCVDPETNEQLFTEEDVEVLKTKNLAALRRLGDVAFELGRMAGSPEEATGK